MDNKANLAPLGYAAFALTLWIRDMASAGWFGGDESALSAPSALVLGGCVMAIAGIIQCLRQQTFDAVLFLGFAGYWWIAALGSRHVLAGAGPFAESSAGFLGWYDIVWAVWAFCLWLAALRDGVARMLFSLGLCVSLLAFGIARWTRIDGVTVLGGYLGLITAIVGLYIAAAELINELHGHIVLPLGRSAVPGSPRDA